MNIQDALGLGKILPVDKLMDIVASASGRLSKSYFDRKDIETKAYEIKKIAEARAEELKTMANAIKENFQLTGGISYKENSLEISSPKELPGDTTTPQLIEPSLEERSSERLKFQAAKKQLNLESITAYAAEELKNADSVINEPMDEDWKTRFFNISEGISSEEMQALWGRILAGEIKQPNSYSLRTLELLKNLNKKDAESFIKFGQLAITSAGNTFILNFQGEKLLEDKYQLTFKERLLLEELGLLAPNNLQFEIKPNNDKDSNVMFKIGNQAVILYRKKDSLQQSFPILVFTKIGQELLQLIESKPELDYIQLLASKIRRNDLNVKYGTILKMEKGRLTSSDLMDVPLTDEEMRLENEKANRNPKS